MNVLKSFSVYTFVGFFGAGVNFLLMPILSHYLSPTDYGITSLINTYVTLVIPIVSFVASSLINVEYFQLEDKKDFASLFSSVSFIPVVPTVLLFLLSLTFYSQIEHPLEFPPEAKWWALSTVLIALLTIYMDTAANYQVIAKQPKIFAAYNLAKTLTEIGLTVLFVIVMKMGWKGRILSWLISSLIFTGVAFLYFYKEGLLTTKIKWVYVRQGIIFGAPLILHTIGKFVINQSDRLFIIKMVSIEQAGIYNVGYTIGSVVMIFANAFSNIFTPFIMERLKKLDDVAKRQIVGISYGFGIGMIILLCLLSVGSHILFEYFISKRYRGGAPYVFWVGLGYVFWAGYLLFSSIIFYYKQGKFLAWVAIVNVVTNILFNYVLIRIYGGIGAAYATAISFFIVFVIIYIKANKLVALPWRNPPKVSLRRK